MSCLYFALCSNSVHYLDQWCSISADFIHSKTIWIIAWYHVWVMQAEY